MKLLSVIGIVWLCSVAAGQHREPERTVEGNSVVSQRDPGIRIVLPSDARYVGVDRWDLFGVADCEVHVFVEADAQQRIRSFYWIQFEQYLPTQPDAHHDYKDERRLIGGVDTYVRARFGRSDEAAKPGSDLEHVQKLLATAGFTLPAEMMNVRLVRLLDPERRKELMVIYAEDLAPTGAKVADLLPGGTATHRWPALQEALIARAQSRISFQPLPAK